MIRKKQFIKDFKRDDIINDVFVVKFKKPIEQYKNGYKFELRVADSSKEIMYKYWGPQDEAKVKLLYDSIQKDDVIHLQGRVNEWNNAYEISANDSFPMSVLKMGEYDVLDFIKKSTKDKEVMYTELLAYIESISSKEIKDVANFFFKNDAFASSFKVAPAAMYIHHGWISGLLEHTLELMKLGDYVCKVHPKLNRDYVIAGTLLHDIGKMDEFTVKTSIDVTDSGVLVGHVTVGVNMMNKAFDKLSTPADIRMKLTHILLTHMGEYGSNKKPSFPEALAVYHIDHLNGDIVHMLNLMEESNTEDDFIYNKDFGNIYLK